MHIRLATLQNLEALVPLFDGYRIFYRQPSSHKSARSFLKERLSNKDSFMYIAFAKPVPSVIEVIDSNKAVGFTQLYPIFSSVSIGRLCL